MTPQRFDRLASAALDATAHRRLRRRIDRLVRRNPLLAERWRRWLRTDAAVRDALRLPDIIDWTLLHARLTEPLSSAPPADPLYSVADVRPEVTQRQENSCRAICAAEA
jgi:hypothetical protein